MSMQRLGKGLNDRESPGMSVQTSGKPSKARARRERTPCAGSQGRASVTNRKKEKGEKRQVQEAVKVRNAEEGKQEGRRQDKAAETAGKPSTGSGDNGCVAATDGEERESGLEDVEQEWFLCKVILFKTRKDLNNDLRMVLRVYLRFIESCCGELFHHLSGERAAQLRRFKEMAPLLVRAVALEIAVSEEIDPECPPPIAAHHPRVPLGVKEEERVPIAHDSNNTSEDNVCRSPVDEALLQRESRTILLAEHLARTFVCLTREVLGDLLGPYMKHMLDMIDNYCDILTENRDEPLLQDLYRQLPDLVRAVALEILVAESNGLADPGPGYDYNAPLDFKYDQDSYDAMIKMAEGMDGMVVPGEGLMGAAGAAAAQAADLDDALVIARGAFRAIEGVFDVERLFRDLGVASREWPATAAELLAEWAAEQDTQQQRRGGAEEPLGPAAAEAPAQKATAATATVDTGSSHQQPMEQMNKGLSPPIRRSQSLNKLQEGKTQPLETACQAAVPLNATADMDKEKKKSSQIKEGMVKADGEEAIETTVVGSNNIANNGCPKPPDRNREKDFDWIFSILMLGCARGGLSCHLPKLLHVHLHFMENCCDKLFKNLWDEWAAETRMFTQKVPMLVRAVILDIVLTKCPYPTSRTPAGDHTPTADHKSTALPDEKEEACGGDGPENDCCRSTLCELQSDSSAPLPLFKTLMRLMHEMLGELVGKWLRDVLRQMRWIVMVFNKGTYCHKSAVLTELKLQAPMLACAVALLVVLEDSAGCVRTLASNSSASSDAEQGRNGSHRPGKVVEETERVAAELEAALGRARAAFRDIEDAYDVERLFCDLSAACRDWPRAVTAALAEAASRDQRRHRRRRRRRLRKLKRGSKGAPLEPAPIPDQTPKIDTAAVMAGTAMALSDMCPLDKLQDGEGNL